MIQNCTLNTSLLAHLFISIHLEFPSSLFSKKFNIYERGLCMLSARQILESKGFKVSDGHAEALELQWKSLQEAKDAIDLDYLKENKMGLTNVPGGDRIE